ncbi:hypothetical protein BFX06_12515 [Sulfobacillus thermosulfidooxidans]|uniref:DUF2214 domain-containing protein n=1 Tax=Sulfobacillus thermosulfidooxidans TaxID=28034 RepID=A0A1R0IVP4_SULTH|nr:hypothetical protein BFX05_14530 [Sulfobacillus thermosulfidooxidans]OLZ17782.1 hypothetical protein BFX06_12515 [Sulfobacillus thermosulfidooxidans]OLZ22328.1 hypothetical protein BFX07_09470 [Sulfobacillus thermosulfidooxidans]PSR28104.1 MAG: hypothetical protein C7B47_06435 [Sulfobacillus thermosulfidooxidans]
MIYHIVLIAHIATALGGFLGALALSIDAYRWRHQRELPDYFWKYQTYVQINTVLLGIFGTTLYLMGGRPKVEWHLLYGAVALLTVMVERGVGRGRQLRQVLAEDYGRFHEVWVYFGLNLFLMAMYGRGLTTGFFGF